MYTDTEKCSSAARYGQCHISAQPAVRPCRTLTAGENEKDGGRERRCITLSHRALPAFIVFSEHVSRIVHGTFMDPITPCPSSEHVSPRYDDDEQRLLVGRSCRLAKNNNEKNTFTATMVLLSSVYAYCTGRLQILPIQRKPPAPPFV